MNIFLILAFVLNINVTAPKENSSLNNELLSTAKLGFQHFRDRKDIHSSRMVIIDFSKPSSEKRLYVIDLDSDSVLLETYVSHGRNSGSLMAASFSNQINSNKSSLGFFRVGEKYHGKHGESYRLDGLEPGFNDQARARALVIHAAWYADPDIIKAQGRLGRSLGCPALPTKIYPEFQQLITPGTLLFVYYPNEEYFTGSAIFSQLDGNRSHNSSE